MQQVRAEDTAHVEHVEHVAPNAPTEQPKARVRLGAYLNLMKPHVTVLLLGMTLAAMAVAAVPHGLSWSLVLVTLLGGAFAAGSANAINCYWDRDIDQVMSRTRSRTLPAGQLDALHALLFGVALGAASVALFALFVNLLSALLALAAILFYVVIYTMWLKRTTPQNIVIGGAAGAVPVLIGWSAVTNSLSMAALIMFLIIFLWTPPHFWALSLVLKNDYARAGVPMLPVVRGEDETYKQIVVYSFILVGCSLLLPALHMMGTMYLVTALVLGAIFCIYALRLARVRTLRTARAFFWFSNNYLALLFAAMAVDRIVLGR